MSKSDTDIPVIHVVSEGSYSDYSVRCAAATEELANQIASDINADSGYREARVEALPFFDERPKKYRVLFLSEVLWDDGTATDARDRITEEWPHGWSGSYPPVSWRWVRAPVYRDKGGRLEVQGTDHERVRKVFSDKKREVRTIDALRTAEEAP